jgi:glycosyltransferase involved in cell wall biosynthesis
VNPKPARRLVVIPSDPLEAYERAGYRHLDRYFNPRDLFDEVYAVSPLEPPGERRAHGMTVVGVPPRGVGRTLRALAPDVVRAYGGYWPADLLARSRLPDVPAIVSVHDGRPEWVHQSLAHADLVICVSEKVVRTVRSRGIPAERIRSVPNRVDLELFHPPGDEHSNTLQARFGPGRYILFVARLSPEKNPDTLLHALALLPAEYALVFVGLGTPEPYRALADELGVAERCRWVGAIPNTELAPWYAGADCFCVPSRAEGFGVVFIEAAASGAAIVTSDIAPMNEYLHDGESARLVAAFEDPHALATALREVAEDPELAAKLRRGGVTAAQPFAREKVDALEVAVYREALELPPLSPHRRLDLSLWRLRARIPTARQASARALRPFRARSGRPR